MKPSSDPVDLQRRLDEAVAVMGRLQVERDTMLAEQKKWREAAQQAADKSLATFQTSGIVKSIVIEDYNYTGDKGTFSIKTSMVVNPPVPFPGLSNLTFKAQATEPVVGTANPNPPAP